MRAPWITLIPTPPHPNTTTDEPGSTCAVFSAAPTPVITPHPISDATSYGISSEILIAAVAGRTVSSTHVPHWAMANTGEPPAVNRGGLVCASTKSRQRLGWPRRQKKQAPQGGTHEMITWSPSVTFVTPSPTATTSPAPSWPSTHGTGLGSVPSCTLTSEWQTPLAMTLIRTSPEPRPGSTAPRIGRTSRLGYGEAMRTRSTCDAQLVPPGRTCSTFASDGPVELLAGGAA